MLGKISTLHPTRSASLIPYSRRGDSSAIAPEAQGRATIAGQQFEMSAENRLAFRQALDSERLVAKFRVKSAGEATAKISEAVALAELEAYMEQTRGVLVRRHEFDLFSVALSSSVPFGVTIELDSAFDEQGCSNG